MPPGANANGSTSNPLRESRNILKLWIRLSDCCGMRENTTSSVTTAGHVMCVRFHWVCFCCLPNGLNFLFYDISVNKITAIGIPILIGQNHYFIVLHPRGECWRSSTNTSELFRGCWSPYLAGNRFASPAITLINIILRCICTFENFLKVLALSFLKLSLRNTILALGKVVVEQKKDYHEWGQQKFWTWNTSWVGRARQKAKSKTHIQVSLKLLFFRTMACSVRLSNDTYHT